MGEGIRPLSLLLILAIVVVLFGTKRLRNFGRDAGEAIRGFREGISTLEDKMDGKSDHQPSDREQTPKQDRQG